jgi:hypothetical protein
MPPQKDLVMKERVNILKLTILIMFVIFLLAFIIVPKLLKTVKLILKMTFFKNIDVLI